ncbi:pyridoxamine 5'-phosphate oxidase [Nocardiopsis sp. CNR-923]|uniref:pyridoxamine 5'-phosphate oxidase family protein n=1 Tax=Nocardiopsis sp. CNR-923 TaxID=1904965 RepID=UPI00095B4B6C|nr:pyridoxamine 5'-phosphate oxidase family protein [Nocardiopsis sp. CNR-923]OLT25129.1 pyridoxamine 5'-phosphate oxidase [Nocardiopsis sp. CNR-923]
MSDSPSVPVPDHLTERLRSARNAWMCASRRDGSTHLTPVWFTHLRDRWWVCTGPGTVKARNLAADPRVSLALDDGDAPVVAEGTATARTDSFPADVVASSRDRYGGDIEEPVEGSGRPHLLLEIGVRRWLMAGGAVDPT